MTGQPIDVTPGRHSDIGEMSTMLSRAFDGDPVWDWLTPNPSKRAALFATLIRHHHLKTGGSLVARRGRSIAAAALWDPPGRWQHPRGEFLRAAPATLRALGTHLPRAIRLDAVMRAEHPEEPHWYLAVIGSDPSVRGGGFGQALMRAGLHRCDLDHAPAYLESSKPENVPYYQRFGFEVIGEIVVPGGGPALTPMWRSAR